MRRFPILLLAAAAVLALSAPTHADDFYFSTGDPDYRMATASRPASDTKIEVESADDFILTSQTTLTQASFWGLLPPDASIDDVITVTVEIYRVFPLDSDLDRPIQVPTRTNSPSDVEFDGRTSDDYSLSYTVTLLDPYSGADNSVVDGIFPAPDQNTGGEGPVAGQEVRIDVYFNVPFELPADHYFFVPQVAVNGDGDFLWLSAPHPQFTGDLQMWIRNSDLDPDWLRVGTDIVGGTTFNGSFTLVGEVEHRHGG